MTALKYYGKYRGTVVNHLDPLQQGRLQVSIPDVTLPPSSWATPCFPLAGIQAGAYLVPLPGSGVWVEFEQGDADHPIWSGCWYGSMAEIPALVLTTPQPTPPIVFQTAGQTTLMLSDVPGPSGGILLKTKAGALISISDAGIVISNGKGATITLTSATVAINQTALMVT
jgi:uncharacterized protein involved in type VI secretion and phage assembly